MKIGILQTGKVAPALVARHGEYPAMFESLLGRADPSVSFEHWAVVDGVLPESPAEADAWLVTGSKHGVYEDHAWIPPLETFLRGARAAGRPIIGICFGHQIVAQAFGGRAEKSGKGWGLGVHRYEVLRRPAWMADAPDRPAWHVVHQDQVTAAPEDATCLATSAFCPYAMLAYGDPDAPDAVTVQAHPEFAPDFAADLLELRRGDSFPEETARAALGTIGTPVDNAAFAGWILRWLETGRARRAA